jgi:predicted esterase
MRPIFLICLSVAFCTNLHAQTIMGRQRAEQFPINATGTTTNALTWLPQTYAITARNYPLIISLHGVGEIGSTVADLAKLYNASPRAIAGRIADGWNATAVNPFTGVQDSFIVVSPQSPNWSYNYEHLKFILPAIISRYRVDPNRIYLSGISAGGAGTFSVLGSGDDNFISKFAAMSTASSVDVDGVNGYNAQQVEATIRRGSILGVRMWTVAGETDFALPIGVRYHDSTNMSLPPRPNKLTVIAGVGHSAWGRAYDTSFRPITNYYGNTGNCNNGCANGGIPLATNNNGSAIRGSGITQDSLNMYEWFLTNERNNNTQPPPPPPPAPLPLANAGNDQIITLPNAMIALNGGGTPGTGTITGYLWSKQSGPAAVIANPGNALTTVTSLAQGSYVFRLTVTNSNGQTAFDDMQVTVNAPQQQAVNACGGRSYVAIPGSDGGYYNAHPLRAGDTLFLDGSYTYSYIYLDNRIGTPSCPIIITNRNGIAKLRRNQMQIQSCQYIKVLGNNGGQQYGIDIRGRNNDTLWNGQFGIAITGKSKCVEIANVLIRNMGIGIKIGSDGDCDPSFNFPNWTLDSISIHDNKIVRIWNEGMYLGNTSPDNMPSGPGGYDPRPKICNGQTIYPKPARLGNIKVYNNIVDSTGRGGIQMAAASTGINEIYNNTVMHNGMNGDDAQGTAISTGAYTIAKIYNNTISNTYTWGIALLGSSSTNQIQEIVNNSIDSSGFMRSYNLSAFNGSEVDLATRAISTNSLTWPHNVFIKSVNNFLIDSTRFLIKDNIFRRRKGNWNIGMLDAYNTFHKTANFICNNINIPTAATSVSIEGAIPIFYSNTCSPIQNTAPNSDAGPDQSVTLPINTVRLTGNGNDPDGSIVGRLWTKIEGPTQFTIATPVLFQTDITNLTQGIYKFELLVTDNQGAVDRDTVTITVTGLPNIAPVANAGANQTITLPTNTVTLNGSGNDPDGSIASRLWTKLSGPAQGSISSPTQFQTSVTGLVQGVYSFELAVTDNSGATGRDTVTVTVNAGPPPPPNQVPTANAGANQTITLPTNSITLTGSGNDPDGSIASRLWVKLSGPAQGNISSPTQFQTSVTGLVQGVYSFELTVTDNLGASGKDTVSVTVNAAPPPPPNLAPVANAGANQTITLPTNSVTLNGSGNDPDGSITGRLWTKIAGPAQGTITAPAQFQTSVTGLVQGVYSFELTVTDNSGATGKDTILVTVNGSPLPPPVNQAPTANAGSNQIITLPNSSVTLNGSGNDPDGSIASRLWTKIAGPVQGTITAPAQFQTSVTGLVQGAYSFELTVTDNLGATGKDTVNVTVNGSPLPPPVNQVPIANAGPNQTIILPVNSTTINGSGNDPDGSITSRLWTKLSGPVQGSITAPAQFQTTITGLVQGIYVFELAVTDNQNATGRDTVSITVNPAAIPPVLNKAPIADAGDSVILSSKETCLLDGSRSNDPDGSIIRYSWKIVAGQLPVSITQPDKSVTNVDNLTEGTYKFELTVWDNNNATSKDTVYVKVKNGKAVSKLFPNPAHNNTTLSIDAEQEIKTLQIQIIDQSGRIVYREELKPNMNIVNKNLVLDKFPSGYYIVIALVNGQEVFKHPMIKN